MELGHTVHLVALAPPGDQAAPGDELCRLCEAVDCFPLSRSRTLANTARALPRLGRPLQLAYSHQPDAEERVGVLAARGRFDVIHVEHMRGVALAARAGDVPTVFDAVDSISALFAEAARHAPSRAQRWVARLDLGRSRRFEAAAPFRFSRVVVTAQREADAFLRLAGLAAAGRLRVVSNGVDWTYFRPAGTDRRRAVLFTGKLSYHANAAAVLRLVRRIMPLVWKARPETPVLIAGKDPPEAVRRLTGDPRVRVTGYISDMREVFEQAVVAVCPLVYGAGVQNKVLEALSSGVPAMVTSPVASALAGRAGRDYLVADDDAEIARGILTLFEDPHLAATLGASGRDYVVRHHDWRELCARLVGVYREAAGTASRGCCAATSR